MLVAETFGHRISAYELRDDGTLAHRRVFAEFDEHVEPDGIAMDEHGEVWVATCSPEVLRVADGGTVTGRVDLASGLNSYAVALGGNDGSHPVRVQRPRDRRHRPGTRPHRGHGGGSGLTLPLEAVPTW